MCRKLGILFNGSKSGCLTIGPFLSDHPICLTIDGSAVKWTSKLRYLGCFISGGKRFTIDLDPVRRSFFKNVNYILSNCSYMSDVVKLELLEKHCLPILTYCIKSFCIPLSELKIVNSWWNSVNRKIFKNNK
jgi:hypothetical protein